MKRQQGFQSGHDMTGADYRRMGSLRAGAAGAARNPTGQIGNPQAAQYLGGAFGGGQNPPSRPTTMNGWQQYGNALTGGQTYGQPQQGYGMPQMQMPQGYNALMGMMQHMQPGMWGQSPAQNGGMSQAQGNDWTKRIGGNANWFIDGNHGLGGNPASTTYYQDRGNDKWFEVDRSQDNWRQNMDAWTRLDAAPDIGKVGDVRLGQKAPQWAVDKHGPQAAAPGRQRANPGGQAGVDAWRGRR
jgi:hypothetical protein